MIFPWHTDLFQPGRTACVVFRASPLIWPTSSGAHHAPRPLCLRATRCTPGGFPSGAKGVGMIIHYSFPATKLPTSLDPLRGGVYHARLADAVTHRFEETARA